MEVAGSLISSHSGDCAENSFDCLQPVLFVRQRMVRVGRGKGGNPCRGDDSVLTRIADKSSSFARLVRRQVESDPGGTGREQGPGSWWVGGG